MASLNTSLDCQPADLSIGSIGKEDLFICSDIVASFVGIGYSD
jgi:hypothetical protein